MAFDGSPLSLGEFAACRVRPILVVRVAGRAGEEIIPFGHGIRFAHESSWRTLRGWVDVGDVWRWDGEPIEDLGPPVAPTPRSPRSRAWKEWRAGLVVSIVAYADRNRWLEVEADWPVN